MAIEDIKKELEQRFAEPSMSLVACHVSYLGFANTTPPNLFLYSSSV